MHNSARAPGLPFFVFLPIPFLSSTFLLTYSLSWPSFLVLCEIMLIFKFILRGVLAQSDSQSDYRERYTRTMKFTLLQGQGQGRSQCQGGFSDRAY